MNPSVYIETSVIGYLTSWPRKDPTVTGHQNTTKLWWPTADKRFDLFVSQLVIRECSEGEPNDALHIALAATHGVQYLVSWNFRHIVNASLRPAIERICRNAKYRSPILCTPEELLEVTDDR